MLDRSRPYDQVIGEPGASWMQDGCLFDFGGKPIGVIETAEDAPRGDGLDGLHWKQLSAMMSQYGQDYTTKEAAIAFLRGRSA